nr:immunoglobulin light chain junction region [Macaca mulatta]MOY15290.1 immunoglobulin light chain junction region [Macaca mulatta]MOY15609.1 immunoglobulin light chain junction region [Macaca mulatta]MOY16538.1 immunoglobulin light chain junction region [Macaca mulatta]MOY17104.1 immunoglobulin light chain junction region [Macaca mulatta]
DYYCQSNDNSLSAHVLF